MGKTIINVSNQFFEMDGKEGDMLYSFTGRSGPISSDNVLYGKTVNLSEMYDTMLDDVREFLFGGEFVDVLHKNGGSSGGIGGMPQIVNAYTSKKHGISMEWVYNKIHINTVNTIRIRSAGMMTTDIIFNELKVKFGITGIDWMYLYNNVIRFRTNDVEILDYIGNRILRNDIHEYFVTEYNLRTIGVEKKMEPCIKNNVNVDKSCNFIKLEWNNGGNKDVSLSNLTRSYNHCWMKMTNGKNRANIRDYDVLLNGRSVTEVFPLYCPVFSNLRMNYTGIDFDGKNNLKKCSEIAGYSDKGETWSLASIDRIDSNRGYSYDNIRIISQYANQLKNVGSKEQIIRLGDYLKNNK